VTLADERYRSLVETKKFLMTLLSPHATPKVPRVIRERARSLLRHWPADYHLEKMTIDMPHDFAKEMEPLYRMVKQREQELNEEVTQPRDPHNQENSNW
jgi:hypothetical protein